MSRALLDINVLLALLDSDHVDHDRTRVWLDGEIATGWASCAITQNGFVRIVSRPRYPSPVAPAEAVDVLGQACASPNHEFWPCEVSLVDDQVIDRTRVHGPRQELHVVIEATGVERGQVPAVLTEGARWGAIG